MEQSYITLLEKSQSGFINGVVTVEENFESVRHFVTVMNSAVRMLLRVSSSMAKKEAVTSGSSRPQLAEEADNGGHRGEALEGAKSSSIGIECPASPAGGFIHVGAAESSFEAR